MKNNLSLNSISALDFSWILLMIITAANALVAETAEPSLAITALICGSIAYKGRRIMDYFMELNHANSTIQFFMRSYFHVFPALIFLTELFAEELAALTTL
ncbi:MAG: cytochrome C oxidase subunit IV family protein [Colwellia sp.]|uniref:cytochrome C oxidase subunit IV family protein n=1 Tax=Colwellia sp. TaxID=56799 RepID=UPI0025B8552E|nr:cytochrome C oxidase subunit IV family protein [Colwellia sp.]NQZ27272.1 cytochrome C oxidase subunit IV family protein [Colwellia sp.]